MRAERVGPRIILVFEDPVGMPARITSGPVGRGWVTSGLVGTGYGARAHWGRIAGRGENVFCAGVIAGVIGWRCGDAPGNDGAFLYKNSSSSH